jgi:hypothetical protein
MDHAARQHRGPVGERLECRRAVDTVIVFPYVAAVALSPRDRAWAMACSDLRLPCSWFQPGRGARRFYGQPCRYSQSAPSRRLRSTPHISAPCWSTVWGRRRGSHHARQHADGPDDPPHAGCLPQQPGLWLGLRFTRYASPVRSCCAGIRPDLILMLEQRQAPRSEFRRFRLQDSGKRSQDTALLATGSMQAAATALCYQPLASGRGSSPSRAPAGTPGNLLFDLVRLRSGTYQDVGGTGRIVVATHSLVLQFGHKLAFQRVHLAGV